MPVHRPFRNALALAALAGTAGLALAQTPPAPQPFPGFASRPLQVQPITGVDGKEMVMLIVTLAPGAASPPHTHPGDCYGHVLEGGIEMRAEGQAARRLGVGDAYANLGGIPHQFTNTGDQPVKLINVLVVDKGKPRLVPLPNPVK